VSARSHCGAGALAASVCRCSAAQRACLSAQQPLTCVTAPLLWAHAGLDGWQPLACLPPGLLACRAAHHVYREARGACHEMFVLICCCCCCCCCAATPLLCRRCHRRRQSYIKKMQSRRECLTPDRKHLTMTTPFMKAYVELLVSNFNLKFGSQS
jgi:Malate synthase